MAHGAEQLLGGPVPLLSGLPQPAQGLRVILRHSLPHGVAPAEALLSSRVTVLCLGRRVSMPAKSVLISASCSGAGTQFSAPRSGRRVTRRDPNKQGQKSGRGPGMHAFKSSGKVRQAQYKTADTKCHYDGNVIGTLLNPSFWAGVMALMYAVIGAYLVLGPGTVPVRKQILGVVLSSVVWGCWLPGGIFYPPTPGDAGFPPDFFLPSKGCSCLVGTHCSTDCCGVPTTNPCPPWSSSFSDCSG